MLEMQSKNEDDDLLSLDAFEWLCSEVVSYGNRSHAERMALIRAARILFPVKGEKEES